MENCNSLILCWVINSYETNIKQNQHNNMYIRSCFTEIEKYKVVWGNDESNVIQSMKRLLGL